MNCEHPSGSQRPLYQMPSFISLLSFVLSQLCPFPAHLALQDSQDSLDPETWSVSCVVATLHWIDSQATGEAEREGRRGGGEVEGGEGPGLESLLFSNQNSARGWDVL